MREIMAKGKFIDEDIQLFHEIEVDIKSHPDKYRMVGEKIDKYCSIENFWQRRKKDLERLLSSPISDLEDTVKIGYLRCMIDLREGYAEPAELLKKRPDYLPALLAERGYHEEGEEYLTTKDVEKIVKGKSIKKGRIIYDLYCYFDKRTNLPISVGEAKGVCLLTWLITDAEVEKSGLNITEYEKWSRSEREHMYQIFFHIGSGWLRFVRKAWAKIQFEDSIKTEQKITPQTELDEVDNKIIELYQESQNRNIKMPSNKIIATALYDKHITLKKLSRETIRKRIKKLRKLELISSPDDNKGIAKRCTDKQIEDLDGKGDVRQRF